MQYMTLTRIYTYFNVLFNFPWCYTFTGHGNSAFETADAIYGHANHVHIVGRSRVRLSWETHYVGDIRYVMFLSTKPVSGNILCWGYQVCHLLLN